MTAGAEVQKESVNLSANPQWPGDSAPGRALKKLRGLPTKPACPHPGTTRAPLMYYSEDSGTWSSIFVWNNPYIQSTHGGQAGAGSPMWVLSGCRSKWPQTGWLKTGIYSLPVLEARSFKSRCGQGHIPSRCSRREPLPCLFQLLWLLALLDLWLLTPTFASVVTLPSPLLKPSLPLSLRKYVIPFRVHPNNTG